MLIKPKSERDDDNQVDDSSQGSNNLLLVGGGVVAIGVLILVVYLNISGSAGKTDDVVIQPVAPVNPVVIASTVPPVDASSRALAKTNNVKVPYGGEHLQKNLDSYRAKQADDLRRQLDAKPKDEVGSLTIPEERIRKLEQSGNVVW